MSYLFLIEGVDMPVVSVFGLFGNVLSIIIFYNRHGSVSLNSSFTNLLICLAVFDSAFLICANIIFAVPYIQPNQFSNFYLLALPYLVPLASMAMTGSVSTVVAITIERYATLRQCRSWLLTAGFLIIFIIFFSAAYNQTRKKFWMFLASWNQSW